MSDGLARFCTACGFELDHGSAFCTACGARTETPTPPPAAAPGAVPQPAPSGERTLAVIGNITQVAGFMGVKSKTYSLLVTDRRVIFAQLTKEKITAMVNRARDEAKAAGKGVLGQWGAQLGMSFNYHEAYWQMEPEAALAETSGNFAVDRSDIRGIKYKAGTMDDDGQSRPDVMTITTTSGTYKLQVNGSLSAAKDAFRQAGIS
jgi:hypothetical protein